MTIQIQLILAAVLALGGFAGGWYFNGLREGAKISQMQRDSFQSLAKAYAAQQTADALKLKQKEGELDGLKANALKYPDVAFRVCKLARPSVSAGGSQGQDLHPPGGVVQEKPEPVPSGGGSDDQSIVFGLADAADKLSAGCRAL